MGVCLPPGGCGNLRGVDSVSVVIPTRDRRAFVLEAVASVLAQRGVESEAIVVDDGSSDGTREALAPLADRIRYVEQEPRGVSAARNTGARLACGSWLAFLDSDDLWKPDKLARQLAFHARHPELDVSQTEEIWIRNGARVNPCRHHRKPAGDIFLPSLERCLISPSAVMLRRDLFLAAGGFDESLPVCEDYDLWLRLGSRLRFGLIEQALVVKRGGHADQLSRRFWGMDRFRVASLAGLLARETGIPPAHRVAAAAVLRRKCTILAAGARRRGRLEEAARYARLSDAYGHA
jgi:glycosyltransferase involved in cell wall biosynthesis